MENEEIHLRRPSFFDPDMAEVASFHHRSKIYESHLKNVRIFLWVALIVFASLFFWYGENGRYVEVYKSQVMDTKTGTIYPYSSKKAK